jgi:hypothetical protein
MDFSAQTVLALFRWGHFNLSLPRLVTRHRHKPFEYPDRRALGASFDLIS